MQSSLAVFSGVCGGIAFYQSSEMLWLVGAATILLNWPYSIFVIFPLNRKIEATALEDANAYTVEQIRRWGRLHAGRTALGFAATAIYLWALLSR